jgi:hypothetical protein
MQNTGLLSLTNAGVRRTNLASTLLFLLLAPLAGAQEVSRLDIAKGAADSFARTSIDIYVPLDIVNLDFNNPINADRTVLAVARDDSGTDLLAVHEAEAADRVAQGYPAESPISFAGIADYANERDVKVGVILNAVPGAGARVIEVEGTIGFNFIDKSQIASTTLESIPMEMDWNSPGVETSIGLIKIEPSSSMYIDGVQYQGYQVVSPGAPIIAVGVAGGDASAEAQEMGMGLELGMFVIKEDPPRTVDLDVSYAATETQEIPFKLSFGVGF